MGKPNSHAKTYPPSTADLQRHPKLMRQCHSEFHHSVWAKTGLKLDLTS